jgi:hypothetical protein
MMTVEASLGTLTAIFLSLLLALTLRKQIRSGGFVWWNSEEKRDVYWQSDPHSYLTQYFSLQINHQTNQKHRKDRDGHAQSPIFIVFSPSDSHILSGAK